MAKIYQGALAALHDACRFARRVARVAAGLMLLVGSWCTAIVAAVYLANGGLAALGEHLTGVDDASLGAQKFTHWALVLFGTSLVQLVAALFLLKAKASGFVAAVAVLSFGVCLYDLQYVPLHVMGLLDAASIVGSFFAFPVALGMRRKAALAAATPR
ncbi:MAG TPA: hypothetical protein VL137_03415 [Polyangiaceae bacterium]|jgi:hypothetical protein|nr:hypothetical protein [Polyangiaceae bacterium]